MKNYHKSAQKRNKVWKTLSYLIVFLIIFFLAKQLLDNWQQIKDYQFSFNYFYLLLSSFLLALGFVSMTYIWQLILKILEPALRLSFWQVIKIYLTSEISRYLPGKIWPILGKIYLIKESSASKKNLLAGSLLNSVLSLAATFTLGLVFISFSLGNISHFYYYISLAVMVVIFIVVHPKIFYFLFNSLLKRFKKIEIAKENFISYQNVIKITSLYLASSFIRAFAFFWFVKSITAVSFSQMPAIVGAFALSTALGVVAVFTPSGLGVKEGMLVVFLRSFLTLPVSILISFLARIWHLLTQLGLFLLVYLIDYLKGGNKTIVN